MMQPFRTSPQPVGWTKALSLSRFVGLALVLRQIESAEQWPQRLLDAEIAMIPKDEGGRQHTSRTAPSLRPSSGVPHLDLCPLCPRPGVVLFLGA